jgi:uncharacterized protein YdhG (YjbR/CyaY superfamily)
MRTKQAPARNIDEYIAGFPPEVRVLLEKVRMTIKKAAPTAVEAISYQIPTFKLNGKYLIYFAGFKNHISIYPAPRGAEEFKKELTAYAGGKGTVRFPLGQKIPFELITRIVKFKVAENRQKARVAEKKR